MGGNRVFRGSTHDNREELQVNKRESQYNVQRDSNGFDEVRDGIGKTKNGKRSGGARLPFRRLPMSTAHFSEGLLTLTERWWV